MSTIIDDAWDVEAMSIELAEYELSFMHLSDIESIIGDRKLEFHEALTEVKNQILQKYRTMEYLKLLAAYKGVFSWPESANEQV